MIGNSPFYFGLIRKYVTTIGLIFENISIIREPTETSEIQIIKVPITYSPKEKVLARFNQDPNIDKLSSIELPMISFELLNLSYDSNRKLNSLDKISIQSDDKSKVKYQYNPVPYNFNFRVSVYVKNTEDGTKIIEQILPMFTPDFTISANLVEGMNIITDLPIILNQINMEDQYEGNFNQRKVFIWTLHLTLKGYLYGPIKNVGTIRYIDVNMYVPKTNSAIEGVNITPTIAELEITPGLTSTGIPTSNSSLSISPLDILASDKYGFCIDIKEP